MPYLKLLQRFPGFLRSVVHQSIFINQSKRHTPARDWLGVNLSQVSSGGSLWEAWLSDKSYWKTDPSEASWEVLRPTLTSRPFESFSRDITMGGHPRRLVPHVIYDQKVAHCFITLTAAGGLSHCDVMCYSTWYFPFSKKPMVSNHQPIDQHNLYWIQNLCQKIPTLKAKQIAICWVWSSLKFFF